MQRAGLRFRDLGLVLAVASLTPLAAFAAPRAVSNSNTLNEYSSSGLAAAGLHSEEALDHLRRAPESWQGFGKLSPAIQSNLRDRAARPKAFSVSANVQANNLAGDASNEAQSEVSVAARGLNVLVAWNDSRGFTAPNTISSYAYSCDGGLTFTDGGNVPLLLATDNSFGDCVLDVDNSGNFFMSTIYTRTGEQDVAIYKGTFGGGCSFTWQNPVVVATGVIGVTGSLDKNWSVVSPSGQYVYVSFTRFPSTGGSRIEVATSSNFGASFAAPVVVSTAGVSVQGSQVAVGPAGEVHVVWGTGGLTLYCDQSNGIGLHNIEYVKSVNNGGAYTLPAVISTTTHNAMCSDVSDSRGRLNSNPDIATDRTGGPYNGSVYVTWSEAGEWTAVAPTGVTVAEAAPTNDLPSTAQSFNIGDNVTGALTLSTDSFDYWKVVLTAGQAVMFELSPQGLSTTTCSGSSTRRFGVYLYPTPLNLAVSPPDSVLSYSQINGFFDRINFDIKKTGTYYVRVRAFGTTAAQNTGTYTMKTRLLSYTSPNANTPARDMRDIVEVHSNNGGTSWSAKQRVNDDAAGYSNWGPFNTVDGVGRPFIFWYDRRQSYSVPASVVMGQITDIFGTCSGNGGTSWDAATRVTDVSNFFSFFNSLATPNYGDYNTACATGTNTVYAAWSDQRAPITDGPDAEVAKILKSPATAVRLSGLLAETGRGYVDIKWNAFVDGVTRFTVERSTQVSAGFEPVGDAIQAAGNGDFSLRDASARPGTEYYYRVGYSDGSKVFYSNPLQVRTPKAVFALAAVRPNPTSGPATIAYEIALSGRASLEIYNLAGQRVRTLLDRNMLEGIGSVVFDGRDAAGRDLPAGAYFARLTSGGQALTQRVMYLH